MNICDKCDTINPDNATECASCDKPLSFDNEDAASVGIGDGYLGAMGERPTSVTALCWLILGLNVISLVRLPGEFSDPAMSGFANLLALELVLIVMDIVCAIAILNGQAWGRTLAVIMRVVGLVVTFAISPAVGTIKGAFFVIVLMILYSHDANEYFSRSKRSF